MRSLILIKKQNKIIRPRVSFCSVKIRNSLKSTEAEQVLSTLDNKPITWYSCGPTGNRQILYAFYILQFTESLLVNDFCDKIKIKSSYVNYKI